MKLGEKDITMINLLETVQDRDNWKVLGKGTLFLDVP